MNDTSVIAQTIPSENMPIKLGITEAAIKKLKLKYKNVPDAMTAEGYKKIVEAKAELTPLRTGVEKERKLQVAAALAHNKRVNLKAKTVTDALKSIEEPYNAAKKAVDDEDNLRKLEEEEKEISRIENIESMIADIGNLVNGLLGANSETILEGLDAAKSIVTSSFEEYEDVATEAMNLAVDTLQKAYDDRLEYENKILEQEEMAILMAKKQAEIDARQAELDAKEAEQKQAERDEKIKLEAEETAAARIKLEAEKKIEDEKLQAEAREADKKHKSKINNQAVKCLVDGGISDANAKKCITIIAQRKVANVVISY